MAGKTYQGHLKFIANRGMSKRQISVEIICSSLHHEDITFRT